MNNSIKKVIAAFLALILVVSISSVAFADGIDKNTKKDDKKTETAVEDDWFSSIWDDDTQDDCYFDEDDDDAFTVEIEKLISRIKDEKEREKVEKLYKEYLKAMDDEQKAYDKLIDAENALYDALESAEYEEDEILKDNTVSDEDIEKFLCELENMSFEELMDLLSQFMVWYSNNARPTDK